ncbi:ABC transporter substrate-binding protein [Endozoicomonas sp. 4G]|uniref:heme/hemin ABC transporter substrate-binding protein n=1 Tax=Endozoicomonas sp. 4G TaxID=2872754 RepID=UPI00207880F1|nr:ABC transporter substrate-binding protein [Endozoicomonas sp. 4G]
MIPVAGASTSSSEKIETITKDNPRLVVLDAGIVEVLQALDLDGQLLMIPDDLSFEGQYPQAYRYKSAISIESILTMHPDAILGGHVTRDKTMMDQSKTAGLSTFHIDRTLSASEKIRKVAEIFGVPERGQALIESLDAQYAEAEKIAEQSSGDAVGVIHISSSGAGNSGQTAIAGRYTPAHEVINAAGGKNLADLSVFYSYSSVTQEGLIALAPEAVIVSDKELAALGGEQGIWQKIPGLMATPAGKNKQLIILPHNGLKNGSVASGEAVIELAGKLSDIQSS